MKSDRSTLGEFPDVLAAIHEAAQKDMITMGFSGPTGELGKIVDTAFQVPCDHTPRIQEVHLFLAHMLCELMEIMLFSPTPTGHTT